MRDVFGVYNMRSRISVGVIVLAPLIIQIYILFPVARNISSTLIITGITFSFSNLLILIARLNGGKVLHKCFPDGLPAQSFLIPEDTTLDEFTKERYYKFFQKHLRKFKVTDNAADMKQKSESAIKWLIARTRNSTKFPLIAEENINLGFAYNTLGVKPFGIMICVVSAVGNIVIMKLQKQTYFLVDNAELLLSMIFTIGYLLMWVFLINKKLVKNSAKKYAFALLAACDSGYFD